MLFSMDRLLVPQSDSFGAVENALWATNRVPSLGAAVRRVFHPRDYSFTDDVALQFRHGTDDSERALLMDQDVSSASWTGRRVRASQSVALISW